MPGSVMVALDDGRVLSCCHWGLAGGEPITVRYGKAAASPVVWSFGALDKSQLDR